MKNTLKGINSRISEAEEKLFVLEERIVEINAEEQNNVKTIKRTENSPRNI